jgi:mRNA-degrading endonuclease toxin of MazEF toxin-antitoxin module
VVLEGLADDFGDGDAVVSCSAEQPLIEVGVAEILTSARGLAAEVDIDHVEVGLDRTSVINCDGLHTVAQASLTTRVGAVDRATLERVCSAVSYALGC